MNTADKYRALCNRRDELQMKLAKLDGERQVHLKRMNELGFNSIEEVQEFLAQKKKERAEKEARLEELVTKFEQQLVEAETKLKEIQDYAI